MALYVVRHQHDADRCPAGDPDMGATLLNYLSRSDVERYRGLVQELGLRR